MGVQKEIWTRGPHKHLRYRRRSLVTGIRWEVFSKKVGIHAFQAPSIVQEYWDERNPRDELLLANPENSSSLNFLNSQWSDYNKCTNILINIARIS
jgi:hypothetical protein